MIAVTVITILPADRVAGPDTTVADTRRRTPGEGGGIVPARLAGYVYDGAAYCPGCAEEVTVESADDGETYTLARFPDGHHDAGGFGVGIVTGTSEWDYPGATCHECGALLDTNVLVYDDGGAHPHPVVRVRDPDRVRDPVTAYVLTDPDGEEAVEVVLAESFGSHGDAGDVSWIPRSDVVGGLGD